MSSTTLIEAERNFASALDRLRRKQQADFASWLNTALTKNSKAAWQEIPQRISLIRRQFADEFVTTTASAVIETLSPNAKQEIVNQLRLYENRDEPAPTLDLLAQTDDRWRPGTLRAMLGAAIGAAAALLLLALQANGFDHNSGATRQSLITQQPATPAATPPAQSAPGADNGQTAPSAPAAPVQPASSGEPEPSPAIEQSALRIIIGALGAAFGAFVVVCPPFRILLARFGPGKGIFGLLGKFGIAFLFIRRAAFAIAMSAVIMAAAGVIGLVFIGPKPLWSALFAIAAILAIVLARCALPSRAANEHEAMREAALNALGHQLGADANMWSALAAGLVVLRVDRGGPDPQLNQIKSVIVGRRNRKDPAEVILRVVEQELSLPLGGASVEPEREFAWKPESAERYEPIGVVKVGDIVTVMIPPNMTAGPNGITEVFEKGKVMRKRTDN